MIKALLFNTLVNASLCLSLRSHAWPFVFVQPTPHSPHPRTSTLCGHGSRRRRRLDAALRGLSERDGIEKRMRALAARAEASGRHGAQWAFAPVVSPSSTLHRPSSSFLPPSCSRLWRSRCTQRQHRDPCRRRRRGGRDVAVRGLGTGDLASRLAAECVDTTGSLAADILAAMQRDGTLGTVSEIVGHARTPPPFAVTSRCAPCMQQRPAVHCSGSPSHTL